MIKEFGAFGQGIDAAKQGLPESENPYHEQDNNHSQWQLGYKVESVKAETKQSLWGTSCNLMNV